MIPDGSRLLTPSIVAFVDALGTKNSTKDPEKAEDFLTRLLAAKHQARPYLALGSRLDGIAAHWFSDNLCVSVPLDTGDALQRVVSAAASVQAAFALHGIFLRGGIALGGHYSGHDDDYGPGLVAAYQYEVTKAVHPRIVLSDEAARFALGTLGGPNEAHPLARDMADGSIFVDFLQFVDAGSRRRLRGSIEAELTRARGTSHEPKMVWLATYYNHRTATPTPIAHGGADRDFEVIAEWVQR